LISPRFSRFFKQSNFRAPGGSKAQADQRHGAPFDFRENQTFFKRGNEGRCLSRSATTMTLVTDQEQAAA
jgi:hypothetical protein